MAMREFMFQARLYLPAALVGIVAVQLGALSWQRRAGVGAIHPADPLLRVALDRYRRIHGWGVLVISLSALAALAYLASRGHLEWNRDVAQITAQPMLATMIWLATMGPADRRATRLSPKRLHWDGIWFSVFAAFSVAGTAATVLLG